VDPRLSGLSTSSNAIFYPSELPPVHTGSFLWTSSDIRTNPSMASDVASFFPTGSNATSLLAAGSNDMHHPNQATHCVLLASGIQETLPSVMSPGVTAGTCPTRTTPRQFSAGTSDRTGGDESQIWRQPYSSTWTSAEMFDLTS
jgi:hypothetical protein